MRLNEWFKKHFALGVILSGAAGSIVAWMVIEWKWPWFLDPIQEAFFTGLSGLWWVVTNAIGWVLSSTLIPRWWYAVLLIAFGRSIYQWVRRMIEDRRRRRQPIVTGEEPLNRRDYNKDVFAGIEWRWKYNRFDGSVHLTGMYCPQCGRMVDVGDERGAVYVCSCRMHGELYRNYHPLRNLQYQVLDEIRLKLENGEWKAVVRAMRLVDAADASGALRPE